MGISLSSTPGVSSAPALSTITAVGNAPAISMAGMSTATVHVYGTYVGLNLTFEQSPDSTNGVDGNWFATVGSQIDANTVVSVTGAITSNAFRAWDISAPSASYVRARATAITSGTANVVWTASTAPLEVGPGVGTHAITGTVTATMTSTTVAAPAATIAGATVSSVVSAATTNATALKASQGRLIGYDFANSSASWRYLKLYSKATAPAPASDTPLAVVGIPPGARAFNVAAVPLTFTAGIAYLIVSGSANTDATAIGQGEVVGSFFYV